MVSGSRRSERRYEPCPPTKHEPTTNTIDASDLQFINQRILLLHRAAVHPDRLRLQPTGIFASIFQKKLPFFTVPHPHRNWEAT